MGTALELSDSLYSFCDFLWPFDPLVVNHIKHVLQGKRIYAAAS